MQVKLLAFSTAAASLGWRERTVECSETDSALEVFKTAAPGFDPGGSRVAINCEYAEWEMPIGSDVLEIAIIPPVSGG